MKYLYPNNDVFCLEIDLYELLYFVAQNATYFYESNSVRCFFTNWQKAFINSYKSEENKVLNVCGEYFIESIVLNGKELRLHFNIDMAKKLSKGIKITKLSVNDFATTSYIDNRLFIKYSQEKEYSCFNYTKCDEPIILVNYCIERFIYLVIDGNHRVSHSIYDSQFINAVILSINDTLDVMFSDFERAVYLFYMKVIY